MLSDLLLGATILIGVAGVALLIDLARVWTPGSRPASDPEREQLVVALALLAFAGLFLIGRATGESGSGEIIETDPQTQPARAEAVDDASLAQLTVAARLPALRSRADPRKPNAEKPEPAPEPAQPPPAADEAPVSPPAEETDPPLVEPEPTPAPAPEPEPAPAPEPDPPPPVPFDDSG